MDRELPTDLTVTSTLFRDRESGEAIGKELKSINYNYWTWFEFYTKVSIKYYMNDLVYLKFLILRASLNDLVL